MTAIDGAAATPRWRYSNKITRREANRAIYFDFEGRMNEPPALMGVYAAGWFRHSVFDVALTPLVRASRDAGERVFRRRISTTVERELLLAAEREDRRLVAFSEHELRCIHDFVSPDMANRVAHRFLNARKFASAWVNRNRPALADNLESATLENFGRLCGYDWPLEYDVAPADVIKRLREQLATASKQRRPVDSRTTELWARLLGYNRHDCLATKHVVLRALS